MFFVDIDISKRKHDVVVINSNGTVIQKAFSFSNSLEGVLVKLFSYTLFEKIFN